MTENRFKELFPGKYICVNKIKEMFTAAEDRYVKAMSICMILTVAAVFNPVMITVFIFINGSISNLILLLLMIALFVYSFIMKKFSFIGLGAVSLAKLYPFSEAMSDTFIAAAMFFLLYLIFRIKRNSELSN